MITAVDLFAGAGGSSEGARQAGATVVWAANHWPLAVEVHARNHPDTAGARAMGFPDSYQLTGRVSDDCRLVGNAVCPPVMRAIVTEIARRG